MARTGPSPALLMAALLLGVSCGRQRTLPTEQVAASASGLEQHRGSESAARASAEPSLLLTLYFSNSAYVRSGDETLPRLVVEQRSVPHTLRVAEAALRELLEVGPREPGAEPVVSPGLSARVVRVVDGLATVDFAREGLSGGSLAETQLLSAIVWTLTELPTVQGVRLTVAGQPSESLFGHVDTSRPLRRADFAR